MAAYTFSLDGVSAAAAIAQCADRLSLPLRRRSVPRSLRPYLGRHLRSAQ